jgi:tartrate-resistant acid phosphatase type 5
MRVEPYVHLVDVTSDAALIGWGCFHLEDDGSRAIPRGETIGQQSEPLGRATVEVLDGDGDVVTRTAVDDANHAWVHDLRPATTYEYRVTVDHEPFAAGERVDWSPSGLKAASRKPDYQLRTHPEPDFPDPITFLAVGDSGVGIASGESGQRQLAVARTMQRLADSYDVRFVVTLGDTIYHGPRGPSDHSGAVDDDWWLAWFQPYRYLLDHLPFYPTAGNHDGDDEEQSDDRSQLEDNLYLQARFSPRAEAGRASLGPGLFYRLRLGSLLELVCVDTTWGAERGRHWFDEPHHRDWLESAFGDVDAGHWRIPFSHHPAWSAGPHHDPMAAQIDGLVPLYLDAGVRLALHGHEHNFQHGAVNALDYVIAGAGGKLQLDRPFRFDDAGTRSWAAEAHCLLVQVFDDQVVVIPMAGTPPGGVPRPLVRTGADGNPTDGPIVIRADPDRTDP